jgi:hypothetical protein
MTRNREINKMVCARCLLPVVAWRGGWKHAVGGAERSCRKPDPVRKVDHDRKLADALRHALGDQVATRNERKQK